MPQGDASAVVSVREDRLWAVGGTSVLGEAAPQVLIPADGRIEAPDVREELSPGGDGVR